MIDNNHILQVGFRLDGRGSSLDSSKTFFFSPQRPARLWGAPSLLSSGYRISFPEGKAGP
jgi:hypothetical protein